MMMQKTIPLFLLSLSLYGGSFSAGNMGLGLTVGSGSVSYTVRGTESYFIAGVSVDYFIIDGLALGLGYRGWFGGSPTIHQVSVPLTYYMPTGKKFRPYLGAFYRYTDYSDTAYESYNSGGVRVGAAMMFRGGYAGFGWVQEYYLDAEYQGESISGYPEMVVGFSF